MKLNAFRKGPNFVEHCPDGSSRIVLSDGVFAWVDTADYDLIWNYRWFASEIGNTTYARCASLRDGTHRQPYMHALICPYWKFVDHKDGNGLNNRRYNLRETNKQKNAWNQKTKKHTSKYHGVSWQSGRRKWVAQLMVNGKQHNLGRYDTEEEAYQARLKAENSQLIELRTA